MRHARAGHSRLNLPLAVLLVAAVALFLGKFLAPEAAIFQGVLGPVVLLRIGCLAKLAFLSAAVVLSATNAAAFGPGNPSRLAWGLLAAGFSGCLLGQLSFGWYQVVQGVNQPFPSGGDLPYLLGFVFLVAALVAFLRAYAATGFPVGSARERWLLGAATVLVSAAVAYPLLRPVMLTPAPPLEKALNLAYPLLDFALLLPAVLLIRISLRFRGGQVWKVWLALLSGFLFGCAGDILFAYFAGLEQIHLDSLVDVMYLLSFGLFARGALYQRELVKE